MKRLTIILISLVSSLVTGISQEYNVISRINAIKMDSGQLYGEYTDKDFAYAKSQAYLELVNMYEQYSREHKDIKLDSSKISTLQHFRGKNIRVFAYVTIDSLMAVQDVLHLDFDQFENELIGAKTWNDIMSIIRNDSYSSFFTAGVIDLSVDADMLLKSYVIVARGQNHNIVGIYCPISKSSVRKELLSGKECRITYNKDDSLFWLYGEN